MTFRGSLQAKPFCCFMILSLIENYPEQETIVPHCKYAEFLATEYEKTSLAACCVLYEIIYIQSILRLNLVGKESIETFIL